MRYAPPADATIRVVEGRDRLYINWTAVDADSFAEVKATFRDYFPGRDAVWNPDERAWAIAYHLRPRLERWLARHALPDHVHWERQHRGYERYERQEARTPATLASALRVLHLQPDAPLWAAEAVYKAAVKHTHPDAGGSHEAACAVNQAISVIRECGRLGAAS